MSKDNIIIISKECMKCKTCVNDFLYKLIWDNHTRDILCFDCWVIIAEDRFIDPLNYPRRIESGGDYIGMEISKITNKTIKIICNNKENAKFLTDDIDNDKLYIDDINYPNRYHRVYVVYYDL